MEAICVASLEGHHSLPEPAKMTISTATSSEGMGHSGNAHVEIGNDLKFSEAQETDGFIPIQRQQEKAGALEQPSYGRTKGFSQSNCVSESLLHSPGNGEQVFSTHVCQNGPGHTYACINTNSGSSDATVKDTEEASAVSAGNSRPTVENGHNLSQSNVDDLSLTGAVSDAAQGERLSTHPIINGHDVGLWCHTQLPCPIPPVVVIPDHCMNLSGLPSEASAPEAEHRLELPRIIKHKPSSITFADYDCSPSDQQQHALTNESSDGRESSSEDDPNDAGGEDEDEDENVEDVFLELPLCREFLPGQQRRSRERPRRRAAVTENSESPIDLSSGPKAEDHTYDKKVRQGFYRIIILCQQLNPYPDKNSYAPCSKNVLCGVYVLYTKHIYHVL